MLRRLSRVADSSHYEELRQLGKGKRHGEPAVAEGHVPVYVGEEMERFEVRTELLSRPAFVELLRLVAQEYGYRQRGVLRIPCPVPLFRRLLAAAGGEGRGEDEEEEELLRSLDDELLCLSNSSAPC